MFKKAISAPRPSIFDGSISSRGALTHKPLIKWSLSTIYLMASSLVSL